MLTCFTPDVLGFLLDMLANSVYPSIICILLTLEPVHCSLILTIFYNDKKLLQLLNGLFGESISQQFFEGVDDCVVALVRSADFTTWSSGLQAFIRPNC